MDQYNKIKGVFIIISSSLSEGLEDAIWGLVLGFAIPPIIISLFASSSLTHFIWIYHLISIVITIITIIQEMPKWTTSYSLGWLFGIYLLINTGLVTIIDILICIILISVLIFRGLKWAGIL